MSKNTKMTIDIIRMHIRNGNAPSAQRMTNSMLRILDGKERNEFVEAMQAINAGA